VSRPTKNDPHAETGNDRRVASSRAGVGDDRKKVANNLNRGARAANKIVNRAGRVGNPPSWIVTSRSRAAKIRNKVATSLNRGARGVDGEVDAGEVEAAISGTIVAASGMKGIAAAAAGENRVASRGDHPDVSGLAIRSVSRIHRGKSEKRWRNRCRRASRLKSRPRLAYGIRSLVLLLSKLPKWSMSLRTRSARRLICEMSRGRLVAVSPTRIPTSRSKCSKVRMKRTVRRSRKIAATRKIVLIDHEGDRVGVAEVAAVGASRMIANQKVALPASAAMSRESRDHSRSLKTSSPTRS